MTNYTKLFNFSENSEFFPKNKVLLLDLSLCLVILKSNLNKKKWLKLHESTVIHMFQFSAKE